MTASASGTGSFVGLTASHSLRSGICAARAARSVLYETSYKPGNCVSARKATPRAAL